MKEIEVLARLKHLVRKHELNQEYGDKEDNDLIEKISEILRTVKIPGKYMIVEEYDDMRKEIKNIRNYGKN